MPALILRSSHVSARVTLFPSWNEMSSTGAQHLPKIGFGSQEFTQTQELLLNLDLSIVFRIRLGHGRIRCIGERKVFRGGDKSAR
jgi:hypothetical protein